ncbi:MAG: hypothetical protein GY948_10995 [Alphaproteobacteria bacterium]|nr:hypothetical protein [Alphaproteobacteria bacterium]
MAEVDYYFTLLSPWAYIGHDAFHEAMERTGTTVNYRPINLPQAFEASNTPMLGNRHKTRQDYRTLELQRWGVKRGLNFNYWPAHWPFAAANADKMIISLVQNGESPAAFMREVFTGIWDLGAGGKLWRRECPCLRSGCGRSQRSSFAGASQARRD